MRHEVLWVGLILVTPMCKHGMKQQLVIRLLFKGITPQSVTGPTGEFNPNGAKNFVLAGRNFAGKESRPVRETVSRHQENGMTFWKQTEFLKN
jgi:hypothetical protein